MIVRRLREYPEFIAEFALRFEEQWPGGYGPGGRGSALADLRAFANSAGALPVGVVAITSEGRPCGVAALKSASIPEHSHLSPWAAAGYVVADLRGRGIGAALLSALVAEARALGYNAVFCATATGMSLLQRAGWQLIERSFHDGKPIFLFKSAG